MKIRNQKQLDRFQDALAKTTGPVDLVDTRSNKVYDLRNRMQQQEVLPCLINDYYGRMELFVKRREDEEIMIEFMRWLDSDHEHNI